MHRDACCVLGISDIMDKVVTRKDVEHDPRQGPVLRAAMIFISTIRSQEERAALRTKLLVCNCKPSVRSMHRRVSRPHEEVLELALFTITSTISDYFMRIGAGKFARVRDDTPADARPWPSSITDVIPAEGGEREVLVGLTQWAAVAPGGHSVFTLIGALARYWEPFALQVFEFTEIFPLATRHMQCALDSYKPNAAPSETFNRFITPIIACAAGFFHPLSELDSHATLAILGPIYEKMYAVAVPIEPILLAFRSELEMDDCRRWFALVRRLRPCVGPNGWVIPDEHQETDPSDHFKIAFHLMLEVRNRNQCLHIECTTKILARSAICSRCGIARYCSKQCLADAWDAPLHPHKTVCKRIAALRTATKLTEDKAWAHAVRDSALHRTPEAFERLCVAHGANPLGAQVVWSELLGVSDRKRKFQAAADRTARIEEVASGDDGDGDRTNPESEVQQDDVVQALADLQDID
ncbi:hypothetical protein C8R46DRAFT_1347895 [Mycena filopes]|nr:hypothetical protein C8R46DRAFT_1347895 [Mycena filopes]